MLESKSNNSRRICNSRDSTMKSSATTIKDNRSDSSGNSAFGHDLAN